MSRHTIKSLLGSVIIAALMASSAPVQAEEQTGVSADSIKIGLTGPLTGNASEYSKAQIGAIAYFNWVNENGGIHGREIQSILEDDACDEARGIAAARKLIFQDEVFALNAHPCSGVALAVKPLILETGIPYMVGGAVDESIAVPVEDNIFMPTPPSSAAGIQMAEFVMSRPETRKIAVISHSNEWARSYYTPMLEHFKEKYDIEPIIDVTMERQSTDATPQILQIKQAEVDFVIVLLYPTETSIFLREANKYGLEGPFLGGYGTTIEDQLKRTGDMRYVEEFYTLYLLKYLIDSPRMKKWHDIIKASYPNEILTSTNFIGLGGAIAIVEALKAAGPDLTRTAFIKELHAIRELDTDVMAGPVTFTEDDHVGIKDLYVAGFEGGRPQVYTSWGNAQD